MSQTLNATSPDRSLPSAKAEPADDAIRPFRVDIPQPALADLRRRLAETRLPEQETVGGFLQGVPLKTVRQVLRNWQTDYDWRKVEARINALPNFITEIDGLDIHFIHVRSRHENALPLIVTHGWPGSVIEQLKIIGPLTDPTAHGGSASDAFHLVIPSLPGYGFSGKPTTTGWGPERIARAWTTLMRRLGYKKFVAQGGDWGAIITDYMGVQAPPELIGIHTNMPGAIPADIDQASFAGAPAPSGLSAEERRSYDQLVFFYKHVSYGLFMGSRPQTLTGLARLAHRSRDLPARPRRAQSGTHRAFIRRAGRRPYAGRCPRQCHAVLADQHGGFVSAPLLGKQGRLFQSQGRQSPDCGERLPRRTLPDAADLGGARVSQSHPLQQAGKRWSFRRLGTAGAVHRRASRGLPFATEIIGPNMPARAWSSRRLPPKSGHYAKKTAL